MNRLVRVNGKDIPVTEFDDISTIIERYSQKEKDSIPEYFTLDTSRPPVEDEKKVTQFTVLYLKDIIRGFKLEDLRNKAKISALLTQFNVSIHTICLLYVQIHGVDGPIFPVLRSIDPVFFATADVTRNELRNQYAANDKIRERISNRLKANDEMFEYLKDIEVQNLEFDTFGIKEVNFSVDLFLHDSNTLLDIFNLISLSPQLPIMTYFSPVSNKHFFKVREDVRVPQEIVDELKITTEESTEKIRLKYLAMIDTVAHTREARPVFFDISITKGKSSSILHIEVEIPTLKGLDPKRVKDTFFDSFRSRLKYDVILEQETKIKGSLLVKGLSLDRVTFTDFITNSALAPHFLFMDESKETAVAKERMFFYYKLNNANSTDDVHNAISMIITQVKDAPDTYNINLSRASSYSNALSCIAALRKLLSSYNDNDREIIREDYLKIIPDLEEVTMKGEKIRKKRTKKKKSEDEEEKEEKQDEKKPRKNKALLEARPNLFVKSQYAKKCQKKFQPFLLTSEEYEDKKGEFDEPDKVLEYPAGSGDYYVCEPREEDDPFRYPYLMRTTAEYKKLTGSDYIPCCAKISHYKRKNSALNEYLSKVSSADYRPASPDVKEEVDDRPTSPTMKRGGKGGTHILAANRILDEGRLGEIPFFLAQIVEESGYTKVQRQKKYVLPVLRKGIKVAPDSILWCLEEAVAKDADLLSDDDKERRVKEAKTALKAVDKSFIDSETTGMTEDEINSMFEDAYVDSDRVVRLLEDYYRVNIIVIRVDAEYPDGNIVIPSFSLFPQKTRITRPIIILCKYQLDEVNPTFPYNYELVVDTKNKTSIFSADSKVKMVAKVTSELKQAYESAFSLYSINGDTMSIKNVKKDVASMFVNIATGQYVDVNGKGMAVRLDHNGESLILSVPFMNPIKGVEKISRDVVGRTLCELDTAIDFIEKHSGSVVYQYLREEDVSLVGIWCDLRDIGRCYIPIKPSRKKLADVDIAPVNAIDPICFVQRSKLHALRSARRLADLLKQYTLYAYSRWVAENNDASSFATNGIVVKEGHRYTMSKVTRLQRNDIMFDGDRLIVPSEKCKENLLSYLQVQLMNDRKGVMDIVRLQTLIEGEYNSLSDFRVGAHESVFMSLSSFLDWNSRLLSSIVPFHIETKTYPKSIQPYFFSHFKIDKGTVILIQNAKTHSKEDALRICIEWETMSRNNVDSLDMTKDVAGVSYREYHEDKNFDSTRVGDGTYKIIAYDDGTYGAILPLA